MPATSQAQHGIMGMALAFKRGKMSAKDIPPGVRKKVQKIASGMTEEQLREYTRTKASDLPKHAKGSPTRIRRTRAA